MTCFMRKCSRNKNGSRHFGATVTYFVHYSYLYIYLFVCYLFIFAIFTTIFPLDVNFVQADFANLMHTCKPVHLQHVVQSEEAGIAQLVQ